MAERDSSGRFAKRGDGDSSISLSPEARKIISDLETLPEWMTQAIAKAMKLENAFTVDHIKADYLNFSRDEPPVQLGLRKQTGRLRGSVWASDPVIDGQVVNSAIGSNVEYAAIHEFGGQTRPHVIKPKNGKALSFMLGGRNVVVKSVNHPGSKIPARAPFSRGIRDRLGDYSKSVSSAIVESWNSQQTSGAN